MFNGEMPSMDAFSKRYHEIRHHENKGPKSGSDSCMKIYSKRTVTTRRMSELHLLLDSLMLRRLKADVLAQLPAKRRAEVLLDSAGNPRPANQGQPDEENF